MHALSVVPPVVPRAKSDVNKDDDRSQVNTGATGVLSHRNVSWIELFGALDAMTCYQNFDCSHKASRVIEEKLESREINLCSGLTEKYLFMRTKTCPAKAIFEFKGLEEQKKTLEKLEKYDEGSESGLFLECTAFLDGYDCGYLKAFHRYSQRNDESSSESSSESGAVSTNTGSIEKSQEMPASDRLGAVLALQGEAENKPFTTTVNSASESSSESSSESGDESQISDPESKELESEQPVRVGKRQSTEPSEGVTPVKKQMDNK